MLLAVDVDNNCVRFGGGTSAETAAVPFYEPLIDGSSGRRGGGYGGYGGRSFMKRLVHNLCGNNINNNSMIASTLLFVATASTLGLILFVAFRYDGTQSNNNRPINPPVGDPLLDKLVDMGWNVNEWYEDEETPQYKAWSWMKAGGMIHYRSDGDGEEVSNAVVERFGLMTLYASTNGPKWTRVYSFVGHPSAPPANNAAGSGGGGDGTGVISSTCEDEDYHYYDDGGSTGDGQDTFHVMECDENTGSLTMLTLGDNMMEGTLPAEIALLSNLELLDLVNNNLHGTIPSEISALTNLKLLNVAWNKFDGLLPETLRESVPSLDKVFLEHNHKHFAGNVNEALCLLPPEEGYVDDDDYDDYYDDTIDDNEAVFVRGHKGKGSHGRHTKSGNKHKREKSHGHNNKHDNNEDLDISYSDLITSCNIPDCLCCTSCED